MADGIIGPPHPMLPTATMVSGTVLDPGEDPHSQRVLWAVGPWAVVSWHTAYTHGGAAAVDALPGGAAWRAGLEELASQEERRPSLSSTRSESCCAAGEPRRFA